MTLSQELENAANAYLDGLATHKEFLQRAVDIISRAWEADDDTFTNDLTQTLARKP